MLRDPARRRVLDDHGGGFGEGRHRTRRHFEIENVGVGKLFARENSRAPPPVIAALGVEIQGAALVGIFAVAQRPRRDANGGRDRGGPALPFGQQRVGETAGHRRVIGGCAGEGLEREADCRVASDPTPRRDLVEHCVVLLAATDDDDVRVILRGGPQHRRPSDIDHLDQRRGRRATRQGLREGIERDDHQVNRADAVRLEHSAIARVFATREDAGMDRGMQRLHPAVENLRKSRDLGHLAQRHAFLAQQRRSAAGREDLDAVRVQRARELRHAGLVPRRDEGTPHHQNGGRGGSGGLERVACHPPISLRGAVQLAGTGCAVNMR